MSVRTEIQVRFFDTDALGHVNNVAYALYIEQARVELLKDLRTKDAFVVVAHLSLDFARQIHFGEPVYVLTRVASLGRTSFTLKQDIYAANERAAQTKTVLVIFDFASQKPVPLTEAQRAFLETLG